MCRLYWLPFSALHIRYNGCIQSIEINGPVSQAVWVCAGERVLCKPVQHDTHISYRAICVPRKVFKYLIQYSCLTFCMPINP